MKKAKKTAMSNFASPGTTASKLSMGSKKVSLGIKSGKYPVFSTEIRPIKTSRKGPPK